MVRMPENLAPMGAHPSQLGLDQLGGGVTPSFNPDQAPRVTGAGRRDRNPGSGGSHRPENLVPGGGVPSQGPFGGV